MPDKTGPKDLETVLARLSKEWQELANLLISQGKSQDRVIEVEKILLRDASGQYRGKISQEVKDLIPYSAKELKYLWTMWDEAQRNHQPGRRHRNLFAGAVGVILTGWLIYGLGLSCSGPLGGILMLAGALIGAWHYMKFRRHQRDSALEE